MWWWQAAVHTPITDQLKYREVQLSFGVLPAQCGSTCANSISAPVNQLSMLSIISLKKRRLRPNSTGSLWSLMSFGREARTFCSFTSSTRKKEGKLEHMINWSWGEVRDWVRVFAVRCRDSWSRLINQERVSRTRRDLVWRRVNGVVFIWPAVLSVRLRLVFSNVCQTKTGLFKVGDMQPVSAALKECQRWVIQFGEVAKTDKPLNHSHLIQLKN